MNESVRLARRRAVLGLAVFGGWGGASQVALAQALEIIDLKSRTAEELIPLIRPLMGSGAGLSGSGYTLFVRAGAADLARVRQMVASLDRAARQLVVSVRQDYGAAGRAAGVNAQVGVGGDGATARAGAWDRTSTARDDVQQSVRVQEGGVAWIATGDSTLIPQRSVTRTAGGTVVRESMVERNLATGFSVTPRLSGDMVTLEISAQRDTSLAGAGPGAASVSRVATTVRGRLGEWLEIGAAGQSAATQGSGLLARSSEAASSERRVFIRVEEAR